jgi:hypothetical protein
MGTIHLWSGIDVPICLRDAADADARYCYHFDGPGSVAALCDLNSVPAERCAHDAFDRPKTK